jgi:DNA mismatch repair protein MutL
MSRIRILPEILSNKIAAGEVVERPASVVKELVENAIDAKSSRIMVEIEQGGRKLIRVSDNGHGMVRDDALLSLERYATSKIRHDPDLFAIQTLGFRGEAIPSIASVSQFTLITRETGEEVGTKINVTGGKIKTVTEVGAPAGTLVSVANIFFNTPARRKFLKSINTEMGHIADTISSMALCRPSVQFRLSHNSRRVKNWAPASDPLDRVADVLGRGIKKELHPVTVETEEVSISGWVATPRINRSTARGIYLFVNGRWVKDRVIQHALYAGYSGRLMKGQYPVAVLSLRVPFDRVDVNVHPTKNEIRFVRQQAVHQTVRNAVSDALKQSDPTRWQTSTASPTHIAQQISRISEPPPPATFSQMDRKRKDRGDHRPPAYPAAEKNAPLSNGEEAVFIPPPVDCEPPPKRKRQDRDNSAAVQTSLWKSRFFGDLIVIGQHKGTYIICESPHGLILIDQHAAHERIVFEQLKNRSEEHRPSVQRLLLPETVDLGFREAQILAKLAPELDRYGMEIEPFGGNTFVVKTLPSLLDNGKIPSIISQMVEKAAELGVNAETDTIMDECLMVMACHNAVRAHQRLSDVQIKSMLEQLDRCDNPSHCPHGRPIWIQWTVKDLEKQFQRIV